ncbi:hypothetical protein [Cellulomonas marina]|uniref:Uncharacterized protein n=1 Tax=Cellulomonas marina TaxID=988821 RepID=A0A1I0ZVK7_9CELL|nr:hypothetical protein [Cellulomonas marina]GIG29395.1 hypothetical protein Cma02nite_19950 [Cellulomonas marina]SFB29804.1 hypothetical protein SAMN05421867_11336 [Cellulomonas marina]
MSEQPEVIRDVAPPSPLGWCARHLDQGTLRAALTLLDGTALCRECNREAHDALRAGAAGAERMLGQVQEAVFGQLQPPGGAPRRTGFGL